jgi:hypothetical protein
MIDRDWTWDALADRSIEVTRRVRRSVTGMEDTAIAGTVELRRGVHPVARQTADSRATRLVFFDAIDPKPPAGEFPSELDVSYRVLANWKRDPPESDRPLTLTTRLPMAARPAQTPKLASAGIALSPYKRSADYSASEPRRRALWLEFTEPVADPRDALFARVLSCSPDPMLTGVEPSRPSAPVEPPLPLPSELIRTVVPDQPHDTAGLGAMQQLLHSDSPRHFFVPLPPGVTEASPELFGFFVYELRVGHLKGWSTAQARFGPPLRVTGVQHPAPAMICEARQRRTGVTVDAAYAIPVFENRSLLPRIPNTEIWGLLYAQVVEIEGEDRRNVLIGRKRADPQIGEFREARDVIGVARWARAEIDEALEELFLPRSTPLSALVVELLPELDRKPDPLGADLGHVRILRTSPLTPVPEICL